MKISIAMATYNGAHYLQEQLQSFVDQTRQPDELIITDDCSTDLTQAIVIEFAKTAPFCVEFHRNENNLGYRGNFNAALKRTTGDLVFLSDQDDVWFPKKIEHMLDVAERNPNAWVVMNDAVLTDSDLNEVGLTKIGQIRSAGFPMKTFVMGCCCAVRRELLEFALPIPEGIKGHDSWIVGLAEALNAKVIEERSFQYYRRHDSNESPFIANRTKKVTKADAFWHSFKGVFKRGAVNARKEESDQLMVFAHGVAEIIAHAPEGCRHQLHKLQRDCKRKAEFSRKRFELAGRPYLEKLRTVGAMWRRGEYRQANGLKSAIRDLIG